MMNALWYWTSLLLLAVALVVLTYHVIHPLRIGTKSVLYGAHAFWLHPFFVALGWWLTYTWLEISKRWGDWRRTHGTHTSWNFYDGGRHPFLGILDHLWHFLDPRLWLAFAVHDIGYIGKRNMDGKTEGELHPYTGARILGWFDYNPTPWSDYGGWEDFRDFVGLVLAKLWGKHAPGGVTWYEFVLYHSRYLAKEKQARYSLLCVADKKAAVLEPAWLYLPRVIATGEVWLYMETNGFAPIRQNIAPWYDDFANYMGYWIKEHQGGHKEDTWTQTRQ